MRNGFISNSRKSLKNGSVRLKDSSVVECYRVIVVYAMGRKFKDIFKSFHLPERDTVYATVKRRCETHFVGRSNVIFERARFNRRVEGEKESVVEFIEAFYELAETCQFGPLTYRRINKRSHRGGN